MKQQLLISTVLILSWVVLSNQSESNDTHKQSTRQKMKNNYYSKISKIEKKIKRQTNETEQDHMVHYDLADLERIAMIEQILMFPSDFSSYNLNGNWQTEKDQQRSISGAFDMNYGDSYVELGLYLTLRKYNKIELFDQPSVSRAEIHEGEFNLNLKLYNGKYLDDWVQFNFSIKDQALKDNIQLGRNYIYLNNTLASLYFGKFFDIHHSRACRTDINITRDTNDLDILIKNCTFLPQDYLLQFNSKQSLNLQQQEMKVSVLLYFTYAFVIVMFQIYALKRQMKQLRRRQAHAVNINSLSLEWQCGWTFTLVIIHCLLLEGQPQYFVFTLPMLLWISVTHFFYQSQLLLIVWESESQSQRDFLSHYFREICKQIIRFYFFTFIFFVIMVNMMMVEKAYTIIVFGPIWLPQIIQNFKNRQRRSPSLMLIYSSTLMHIYFPIYLKGIDDNIFKVRPRFDTTYAILIIQGIQLAILTLQSKFGAQFCLPKRYRRKLCHKNNQTYEYKARFEDEVSHDISVDTQRSDQNNHDECVICLNDIRVNMQQSSNQEIMQEYMLTPCKHRFHEVCLQNWMNVKLECPTCRSELPPLPKEEEIDDY